MEQRTIIRFPTRSMRRRRLPFLQSRSGANALRKGELRCATTQGMEKPYQWLIRSHFPDVEGEAGPFMQRSLLTLLHCKWDLLANSSWHGWYKKVPSSLRSPCPGHQSRIRRPKKPPYHMEFFRYCTAFVLLVSRVSSLEMNHGLFWTIPVIRYGRRHEIKYQKEPVKKLIRDSV
jgi:hypothetical protein